MRNILTLTCFLLGVSFTAYSQCDTTRITPLEGAPYWKTTQTEDSAKFAFDNDASTAYQGYASIGYDFKETTYLNGVFVMLDVSGSSNYSEIEILGSTDAIDYTVLARSSFSYQISNDTMWFFFGTHDLRYVRLNFSGQNMSPVKEIGFYEDSCPNSGLKNAVIDFDIVADAYTQTPGIALSAKATGNLPVSFTVVEGTGVSISGTNLVTNNYVGRVSVRASVSGQSGFHDASVIQSFTLYDEEDYSPAQYLSLTDEYPLELRAWEAYPIYTRVSFQDPLNQLNLDAHDLYIDGEAVVLERVETSEGSAYSQYLWQPKEYKTYEVKLVSSADNGQVTTTTENVQVVKGAVSQQKTTLDGVVIWFGRENSRTYQGSYTLPQHVGVYDNITAHLDVECPGGNCDDWDRWAYIDIKGPDGNWIQLIRYITPYGVACDHTIDLTPYASLLQGNVELRVFIDTWGTGGWKLSLDLDFQAGEPEYIYSRVDEIWDGTYDFGNPAHLQPVDTVNYKVADNIERADLLLSTTGHGWGENNTSNAAEFFNAFHDLEFNGKSVYQQNLWNNCNPNPDNCTGQLGSWTYNRAGWCPGAISIPDVYEVKDIISGDSFELTYKFHETYVDKCHPNSSDCKSGTTCPDCNAGYNPHYQIDGHIVNYSNQPLLYSGKQFTQVNPYFNETLSFNVFPNPTQNAFQVSGLDIDEPVKLIVKSIDGKAQAVYYIQAKQLEGTLINVEHLDAGMYFVQIEGNGISGFKELIIH